ncbi:hypothetical protein H0E87_028713, partial [Populus deltoides]
SHPAKLDKGKGIADQLTSLPTTLSHPTASPPLPIPQDPSPSSADPPSSKAPSTIPCLPNHMAIITSNDPLPGTIAPSSSKPSSPATLCPTPLLDPQPAFNTIPPPPTPAVQINQPDLHASNDNISCHESGNDLPTNIHTS